MNILIHFNSHISVSSFKNVLIFVLEVQCNTAYNIIKYNNYLWSTVATTTVCWERILYWKHSMGLKQKYVHRVHYTWKTDPNPKSLLGPIDLQSHSGVSHSPSLWRIGGAALVCFHSKLTLQRCCANYSCQSWKHSTLRPKRAPPTMKQTHANTDNGGSLQQCRGRNVLHWG